MNTEQDYITIARNQTKAVYEGIIKLKGLQQQWNDLDYGNTLSTGEGANEGITKAEVGSVVFDTANALVTLLGQGHGTNLAKLL